MSMQESFERDLDTPQTASPVHAQSISERASTPEATRTLTERADQLGKIVTGQDDLPEAAVRDLSNPEAYHLLDTKYGDNKVQQFIEEARDNNVALQPAVDQMRQALLEGKPLTTLMKEAYTAGKNNDQVPLIALKTVGARMLQRLGPDGHREAWEGMAEDQRQAVRLAEMMVIGAQLNYELLKCNNPQRGEAPTPVEAARWGRQFTAYADNADLPPFFQRDLQAVAGRLKQYQPAPSARAAVPPPSQPVMAEVVPAEPPVAAAVADREGRALAAVPPPVIAEAVSDEELAERERNAMADFLVRVDPQNVTDLLEGRGPRLPTKAPEASGWAVEEVRLKADRSNQAELIKQQELITKLWQGTIRIPNTSSATIKYWLSKRGKRVDSAKHGVLAKLFPGGTSGDDFQSLVTLMTKLNERQISPDKLWRKIPDQPPPNQLPQVMAQLRQLRDLAHVQRMLLVTARPGRRSPAEKAQRRMWEMIELESYQRAMLVGKSWLKGQPGLQEQYTQGIDHYLDNDDLPPWWVSRMQSRQETLAT